MLLVGWKEVQRKSRLLSATTLVFATVLLCSILEVHSVATSSKRKEFAAKVEDPGGGDNTEQAKGQENAATEGDLNYHRGIEEIEAATKQAEELKTHLNQEALPKMANEAITAGKEYGELIVTLDNGKKALKEVTAEFRKNLADTHKGKVDEAETALTGAAEENEKGSEEGATTTTGPGALAQVLMEAETTEARQSIPKILKAPRARQKAAEVAAVLTWNGHSKRTSDRRSP
mmetsp:Transcript_88216/g.175236  ORF Transcript_88216/g.175236 Transcript_88216/m.175236 type:complete len:232 (+) Transcript_88216:88-783(+)